MSFGVPLGSLCMSFGLSLGQFEPSLAVRHILVSFWSTFGSLWLQLGRPWAPIGRPLESLLPFWGTLGCLGPPSRFFVENWKHKCAGFIQNIPLSNFFEVTYKSRRSCRSHGSGGIECCWQPRVHRAGGQDNASFTTSLT